MLVPPSNIGIYFHVSGRLYSAGEVEAQTMGCFSH